MDLGSVRADQEAEKKRRGKGKKQPLPLAQLRPKRRAPISQVLLVGGSTRMPAMRRFVNNMTGLEPATFVQPDEVCNKPACATTALTPCCVCGSSLHCCCPLMLTLMFKMHQVPVDC